MNVLSTTTSGVRMAPLPGTLRVAPLALPFVAFGLVDGLLTAVRAREVVDAWLPLSLLAILGLWLVTGLVWSSLLLMLLRLSLGPRALAALGPRALEHGTALWREPDRARDQRRAATLLAALVALAFTAACSIQLLAYLVTHRHGAVLIAVTFLLGQAMILVTSLLPAAAVRRLCLQRPLPLLTVRHVVGAAVAVIASVALAVAVVAWDALAELDAPSYALLGLALGSGPVVAALAPRTLATPRLPLLAAVVGVLSLMLPLQASPVRALVSRHALTAKHYLGALQSISDVDGDGSPALPYLADCAPFDAAVHPLASELAGNDVDENCDGNERVVGGGGQATARFGPLERDGPSPNLVLITLDSLRVDHLGAYGYARHPTSPNLDAFAAESVRFTSAFSQDSGTVPSMWSLMVGKTPFQTRLERRERFPPNYASGEVKLAEVLSAGGYRTRAVLCGSYFARSYWNIKDGFDEWTEVCGKDTSLVAPTVTENAVSALNDLAKDKPFFLWVHYLDPHKPYADHADIDFGGSTRDRYDEEIAYTDRHLAGLLKALEARTGRPTYVVISADHGENFGEHGKAAHARTLYREVTHVPLIVHGPDVAARDVEAPVALADLFPTLIDLAGLPVPPTTTMVSQAHVLFGEPGDLTRLVFQENSWSRPLRHVKAVVSHRHHMLLDLTNSSIELYDRARDKAEKANLYGDVVEGKGALERRLRDFSSTTELPAWMR